MITKEEYAALNEFGKILMCEVRDRSIQDARSFFIQKPFGITGGKYYKKLRQHCSQDCIEKLISIALPEFTDIAITRFLYLFDQEYCKLIYTNQEGKDIEISRVSDGLVGELCTQDGWVSKYSSCFNKAQDY